MEYHVGDMEYGYGVSCRGYGVWLWRLEYHVGDMEYGYGVSCRGYGVWLWSIM